MSNEPYNLNQPPHRLLHDVIVRIQEQLQRNGVMVKFDSLPAVEDLIDQYNTELTNAWDAKSTEYIQHEKERIISRNTITSLHALLRWGVRMVRKPGQDLERQKWIDDVSAVLPDGKVE
jgi:hypothetical protein